MFVGNKKKMGKKKSGDNLNSIAGDRSRTPANVSTAAYLIFILVSAGMLSSLLTLSLVSERSLTTGSRAGLRQSSLEKQPTSVGLDRDPTESAASSVRWGRIGFSTPNRP